MAFLIGFVLRSLDPNTNSVDARLECQERVEFLYECVVFDQCTDGRRRYTDSNGEVANKNVFFSLRIKGVPNRWKHTTEDMPMMTRC